jgi:putative hydrolase of the HAD superfamily
LIKAVFFDLDGTLYDRDALVTRLVAEQFEAFQDELTGVTKDSFVDRIVELDDHGYRDKRDVYRTVAEEWSLAIDLRDRLHDHFWARYDTHCVLEEDVGRTLAALRRRGLKLAVNTNGSTERQRRKLEALGISLWFEAILISELEGVKKPDPEIFRRALLRCQVDATETLFVGDHPDADVGGALGAGLRAVWKVVPYWRCAHNVPAVCRLSDILPMCDNEVHVGGV